MNKNLVRVVPFLACGVFIALMYGSTFAFFYFQPPRLQCHNSEWSIVGGYLAYEIAPIAFVVLSLGVLFFVAFQVCTRSNDPFEVAALYISTFAASIFLYSLAYGHYGLELADAKISDEFFAVLFAAVDDGLLIDPGSFDLPLEWEIMRQVLESRWNSEVFQFALSELDYIRFSLANVFGQAALSDFEICPSGEWLLIFQNFTRTGFFVLSIIFALRVERHFNQES